MRYRIEVMEPTTPTIVAANAVPAGVLGIIDTSVLCPETVGDVVIGANNNTAQAICPGHHAYRDDTTRVRLLPTGTVVKITIT